MTKQSKERRELLAGIVSNAGDACRHWARPGNTRATYVNHGHGLRELADLAFIVYELDADGDPDQCHWVDFETVERGFRDFREGNVGHAGPFTTAAIRAADEANTPGPDWDASCDDAVIQAGLFGAVVYS